MLRRRHSRRMTDEAAELEVTPFMNLMIVLVPVLLLTLVFTHTTVIDLNFPSGESSAEFDPDLVHLEVTVHGDRIVVGDGRGGAIKTLPITETGHDYATLTLVLTELKTRMPEKRDITILLEDNTNYQTLVSVMDRVRSHAVVQGLDVVNAELFPVVSLGSTPPAQTQVSMATAADDGEAS